MRWSIIKNDFLKNKAINLALLFFIIFSSMLAVMSVLMAVQTFTSISDLYKVAAPPHFLQMHKGEIDKEKINKFMSENKQVTYSQIVNMLTVYGENINIVGNSYNYNLSDCRLDISLIKQNRNRDLLLDTNHKKVVLKDGEVGVPMLLKEQYHMEIGDHLILNINNTKKEFVIKEFILDSMMNSSMASSTRILISDTDFDALSNGSLKNEYLIEAYFDNSNDVETFKTLYQDAELPQNGQLVTYSIIFLMSALTDIVTVFILFVVSILLILVAFICIRFTIMTALEEEINEIGTMKAIGLNFRDIRGIYFNKYKVLSLLGVVLGYVIALTSSSLFTGHISSTFGNMKLHPLSLILGLVANFIVFILINHYCKKNLKKIRNITVIDALANRNVFDKKKKSTRDGLYKSKKLSVNWLMGIREVLYGFKSWLIILSVLSISIVMIMVPVNLLKTFESPEFITYMGSSQEDILIEIENGDKLEAKYSDVKKVLTNDHSINDYYEYKTIRVKVLNSDNVYTNMDIDSGDNAGNGLKYLTGKAPEGKSEIAISYINSNEIKKIVGDTITILYDGKEHTFNISGVYQDVTSGGNTSKSKYKFPTLPSNKYSFSVNLKDKTDVKNKSDEWGEILVEGVNVDSMDEFISQTLGGVSKQLKTIVIVIIIIGSSLVMLITIMFLKLRLAKDFSEISILKAIGFSEKDIKKQYMIKVGGVSILGIILGILLTNLIGESLVNAALSISGIGIKNINLITNSLIEYIVFPIVLIVLILIVILAVMRKTKKFEITSIVKE
ncbi:ABC transporter permease [Clostridium intestinale]|uniref:ABC transporter permease n=1 Tax=Clostridium intestinale TaxID=36845 RepID=UPI0028E1C504|nr:ABC transporter permease [Clostridium intestinale]